MEGGRPRPPHSPPSAPTTKAVWRDPLRPSSGQASPATAPIQKTPSLQVRSPAAPSEPGVVALEPTSRGIAIVFDGDDDVVFVDPPHRTA